MLTHPNPHDQLLRWSSRWCFLIFFVVLFVYLALPTANFYWDGIGYSYSIEHGPTSDLLHPNHLLCGPLGYAVWQAVRIVCPNVRALATLQMLSAVFGASAVVVFYRLLLSSFKSVYVASCLALALAFSGTWWKFSTDADSYVPATCLLLLALLMATPEARPRPVLVGAIHAAAMLLHELAIFFAPALLLALWYQSAEQHRGRRSVFLGRYILTAGLATIVPYYAAFVREFNTYSIPRLLHWVTSYSEDASFSFKLFPNLVTSLVGHVKLFWGGRLSLVRAMWGPFLAFTTLGFVVSILLTFRQARFWSWPTPANQYRRVVLISVVWIAVYCLFLTFWLPHNTFYRLFYVPGPLLLVGAFVSGSQGRHYALAFAVAALFFGNLGFNIYPYAQPQFNGALTIAQKLHETWPPGAIVYWDVYASDNRTIRYFNPQVEWKPVWNVVWLNELEDTLRTAYASGKPVWFDLPALKRFAQKDPEVGAWLESHYVLGPEREFTNGGHPLGFVQITPKIASEFLGSRSKRPSGKAPSSSSKTTSST